MSEEEIIRGCLNHERNSQLALYEMYFPGTMQICTRYAKNSQEAKEILLDSFKNIFNGFSQFAEENARRRKGGEQASLQEWIKKEVISSAIRKMHTNRKEYFVSSTVNTRDSDKAASAEIPDEQIIKSVNKNLLIQALRELPTSQRALYNLHEVDEYSHQEVSKLMDISEHSAKDILSKAKFNLRKNILQIIPKKTA